MVVLDPATVITCPHCHIPLYYTEESLPLSFTELIEGRNFRSMHPGMEDRPGPFTRLACPDCGTTDWWNVDGDQIEVHTSVGWVYERGGSQEEKLWRTS